VDLPTSPRGGSGGHADFLRGSCLISLRTCDGGRSERSAIRRRGVLLSAAVSAARSCEAFTRAPPAPPSIPVVHI
jgi:hypothetical protein